MLVTLFYMKYSTIMIWVGSCSLPRVVDNNLNLGTSIFWKQKNYSK